ncbi:unnamed protein product [Cyclocybe aegerita]|uniref:F-box domain-containing protein n=1 Tax=Cyclocybe aegerita TaxID=1973307 RepID=A0A8S0X3T3_CYCAE|nr:unnamed protein product [Cyclocybe aegerita]
MAQNPANRHNRIVQREALEREVSVANEKFTEIQQQLLKLKASLNKTSLIMAYLPLEVLAEIFTLVVETRKPLFNVDKVVPPSFILGSVSRAWRKVVWSMPRLWTVVSITISSKKHEIQRELLEDWVERSASLGLHIYLQSYWPTPSTVYEPLLAVSGRWESFYASGKFKSLCSRLEDSQYRFDRMSSLQISFASDSILWRFSGADRLKTLKIDYGPTLDLLEVSLSHVEHMDAYLDPSNWVFGLERMPSLRTCKLRLASDREHTRPHPPAKLTTFQRLVALLISIDGDLSERTAVAQVLDVVTAPRLDSLDIRLEYIEQDWIPQFFNMPKRSACQLTTLLIDNSGNNFAEADLVKLLRLLPSLKTFAMRQGVIISDKTINVLNPSLSKHASLPNLTSLEFNGKITFNLQSMLSMVRERLRASNQAPASFQRLETFRIQYSNISWGRKKDPNDLQAFYTQLVSLKQLGTKLDIVWVDDD